MGHVRERYADRAPSLQLAEDGLPAHPPRGAVEEGSYLRLIDFLLIHPVVLSGWIGVGGHGMDRGQRLWVG